MKKDRVNAIAGFAAALMVLAGCEGLVTSNIDTGGDKGSGHYYVDLVPAKGIPVVEDLNNGSPAGAETSYALAEAFNKYDTVYYVGNNAVAVPPGKTLYIAPGSSVSRFYVAAEISKGSAARTGAGANAGPAVLVVLEGATMPLSGPSALGGLLQVNVGGSIVKDPASPGPVSITGAGRVVVGGSVAVDAITVAGSVYVARGDGSRYGVISAAIDTTYLALPTLTPDRDGRLDGSARSDDDFYAFEGAAAEASREVTVDGAVLGNISSGGNVYIAENSRVTGLNAFYGYVAGGADSESVIVSCGKVEALGNVVGAVIAKGDVTVGSGLSPDPHRAQVSGSIYSRAGNVIIKKNASSGDIVAYRGRVTIEAGAAATGVDTCYNDSKHNGAHYDGAQDVVNRGDVIVYGRVDDTLNRSGAASFGSGNITAGGSVVVHPYGAGSGGLGEDGSVSGNVAARRSARIDGVVAGSLDTYSINFDGIDSQNLIVNGLVGGHAAAGGALVVADHHETGGNVNYQKPKVYVNSAYVYPNGYVGGGAAVYGRNGTGPSAIQGFVEGGSLYVAGSAELAIASTGRVNTIGTGNQVIVQGKLAIAAGGELDANSTDDIYTGGSGAPLAGIHVLAHAESLANGGRLGPPGSGIALAPGARVYTAVPVAIPDLAVPDWESGTAAGAPAAPLQQDRWFSGLANSAIIHANVAPPVSGSAGSAANPLTLTVGRGNIVTLTQNTALAGDLIVEGLVRLDGWELELNGSGVIALGSDEGGIHNYETGAINGSISFAASGGATSSLKFNSPSAALNGLSASAQSYGGSIAAPVVIGVQSPSAGGFGGGNMAASFVTPVATQAGGPAAGTFLPGAGAVLEGYPGYAAGEHGYISRASWALWQ